MSPVELNNANALELSAQTPQYSPVELETLNQLADITLPEPIGFWPPSLQACGIALAFMILIVFIARQVRDKIKQNRYRKIAILELENIVNNPSILDSNIYVAQINTLLKRCALSAGGSKNEINSLTGVGFYSFMANVQSRRFARSHTELTRFAKHYLHWQELAYSNNETTDNADKVALAEFAKTWIHSHHHPLITTDRKKNSNSNSPALLEAKTL